jgi:hypothetical protein
MQLAQEATLQPILDKWISDHGSYEFEVQDNLELREKEIKKLQLIK